MAVAEPVLPSAVRSLGRACQRPTAAGSTAGKPRTQMADVGLVCVPRDDLLIYASVLLGHDMHGHYQPRQLLRRSLISSLPDGREALRCRNGCENLVGNRFRFACCAGPRRLLP
jgi:hypothetical protein